MATPSIATQNPPSAQKAFSLYTVIRDLLIGHFHTNRLDKDFFIVNFGLIVVLQKTSWKICGIWPIWDETVGSCIEVVNWKLEMFLGGRRAIHTGLDKTGCFIWDVNNNSPLWETLCGQVKLHLLSVTNVTQLYTSQQ